MNQMAEVRSRGIQETDVFEAADALLAEGRRPTIERVRLKIGRGSPNTVSPMLERWFATLSERLVSVQPAPGRPAGGNADGMPPGVRNAAKLLWESARREAEEVQRGELDAARAALQEREAALIEAQDALARREKAFAQVRASLDSALASSQQARETLERQLKEHALEAQRTRTGLDDEIKRLTALLSQAAETQEQMRREHAELVAAKDQHLRQAEERHAGQERRMLADVDRARQFAKQLEVSLSGEQQQRMQSEEAAAQTLEAGRRMLRDTQQAAQNVERELRDRLAEQAGLLAQAQSRASALQQRQEDLERQLGEERKSHEDTRGLLAGALAAVRHTEKLPRKPTVRRGKSSSPKP
ncbi:DNA-binding protein [Variovorax guangxiensis]|uniref:DNA-binding protein n=1 Tax=Variovorax guangxiensis TaxID=1775474 RepID=UPI00285DA8BB|nr:DNA-binding protein [Variovorax guangxiensis]MDR6859510.1 chromosome segregation ATPase [Variovorax guangxiensis]